MNPGIFDPLAIGPIELRNRIVVSPMCQYSADEGAASDWHLVHVGQFALGGPGLIFLEGTAVEPHGRISRGDLCLFDDRQERALARILAFVREHSDARLGIQLFHAGRKGSQHRPWEHREAGFGDADTLPEALGGWPLAAPSPIPYAPRWPVPTTLSRGRLADLRDAFVASARRAARVGLDTVELHYAHGYLLHSFLSPVSNQRTDAFGGSRDRRVRFPLEVFRAVRDVWPHDRPLGARISGSDFAVTEEGWDIEDAVHFGRALRDAGCDYLDVSGGFLAPEQDLAAVYAPGWQVGLASRIRSETGLPTLAVGGITHARQADSIVREGHADAIAIGRGMLLDPRWPWHAARELGVDVRPPPQYARAFTMAYPDWFHGETIGRPTMLPPSTGA